MNAELEGQVAIVTGGASGIGAATVALLAEAGARVVAADLQEARGGPGRFVPHDVTDEAAWRRLLDDVLGREGRLDILVNNAGISGGMGSIESTDVALWQKVQAVNSEGVFLGCQYAIEGMKKTGPNKPAAGGSIVNISSIMALVGGEGGHPAYHASKGAVRALTKTFAVRYGRVGIRVNAIYPGFLPPMRTGKPLPSDMLEKLIEWTPLGRTGTPQDIAAGVAFLASEDAAFVTGAELVIDGGFVSR